MLGLSVKQDNVTKIVHQDRRPLYVDGMSPVMAYDVYRKMGFQVAREAEVWEATWP